MNHVVEPTIRAAWLVSRDRLRWTAPALAEAGALGAHLQKRKPLNMLKATSLAPIAPATVLVILFAVAGCRGPGSTTPFSGVRLPIPGFQTVPEQWEPELDAQSEVTADEVVSVSGESIQSESRPSNPRVSQPDLGTEVQEDSAARDANPSPPQVLRQVAENSDTRSFWSKWLPQLRKPKRISLPRNDLQEDCDSASLAHVSNQVSHEF